jgi:hypothetical protein
MTIVNSLYSEAVSLYSEAVSLYSEAVSLYSEAVWWVYHGVQSEVL